MADAARRHCHRKPRQIGHCLYQIEMIDGEIDFTKCFRDGFQKPHQKFLLDFMTHTKMVRYPEAVKKLCIDFLRASAVGKPEKYILPFAVALIVY